MRLFRSFRDDRAVRRGSAAFAAALMAEPSADDVRWLAEAGTRGDADHATWELRYLRRALGVLVTQRDALDDRTPSEVVRALALRMARDPQVDRALRDLAERQFNARLGAYRDAITARGHGTAEVRIAQNLLAFAGGPIRAEHPAVRHGATVVAACLAAVEDALRRCFGTVELPDDLPPSQVVR